MTFGFVSNRIKKSVTGCNEHYHLDLVPFHLVVPIALVHRCWCSVKKWSMKVNMSLVMFLSEDLTRTLYHESGVFIRVPLRVINPNNVFYIKNTGQHLTIALFNNSNGVPDHLQINRNNIMQLCAL